MLVTVLIITAIGLLFGAGALLLFRYQCQRRIDRQHELEKIYAVRSAVNYVRMLSKNQDMPDDGKSFCYHTGSERDLTVLVKPVETIFPNTNNLTHFVMERQDRPSSLTASKDRYNAVPDYEYGEIGATNGLTKSVMDSVNKTVRYGLSMTDLATTNSACWWLNLGMRDTGGWLQEDYGRRYYFYPYEYAKSGVTQDVVRLCLVRNVTNESNAAGCRRGWPLSQENERALVFEIRSRAGNATNNAEMVFYEYVCSGGAVNRFERLYWSNRPSVCYMGLQLASDKASLFYVSNAGLNDDSTTASDDQLRGYTFSDPVTLQPETYRYFSQSVTIGGKVYGGIFTNDEGRVQAPELRAVFEVERKPCDGMNNSSIDFLSYFRVKPAYQYDIYLEHPQNVVQRATVAQKIGTYSRNGSSYTMFTYDTHGTEHKGFRYDEKHAGENGN